MSIPAARPIRERVANCRTTELRLPLLFFLKVRIISVLAVPISQAEGGFLMGIYSFQPFSIEKFFDQIADAFNEKLLVTWSVDEFVLHPIWAASVLVALVLYAASVAPAMLISNKIGSRRFFRVVEVVNIPLQYLSEKSKRIRDVLVWYLGFYLD